MLYADEQRLLREQALSNISYWVDDACNCGTYKGQEIPDGAWLVLWDCGFEPLVVAAWSYLPGAELEPSEAEDLAREFLLEQGWFDEDSAPDCRLVQT